MTLWTPPGADLGQHAGPRADGRMVHFIGGMDPQGRPLPMTFRRLKKQAETWPVTDATPAGPAALLKTAREMVAHGFYVYEFLRPGAGEALHAGRDIRNGFVHEGTQPVWTFGMADQALRTPHAIVAELYPDASEAELRSE